ncbi:MAG TPA: riboflavin biosynthesis protein RibF [Synergistaceae bacterium]|nr:riboflavin biosynthesis protein RibF [Synergistaceae bacterium]
MIAVIGSFDGFHLGHKRLFRAAEVISRRLSDSWCVVTFFPHPQSVLGRREFMPLFTEPEKDILGRCLGVPEIVRIPFTRELAEMGPDDFLGSLESSLFIRGLVVGEDFRFGRNRSGDAVMLRELASNRGWEVEIVPALATSSGRKIGSSFIRESITRGNISDAAADLGYPFMVMGVVVHGDGRGRTIGFPTVNLSLAVGKLIPARGVYSGGAVVGTYVFPAAINIGLNPTFPGERDLRCEAHIPGFRGDLYGKEVSLFFLRRLRREMAFPSTSLLVEQMRSDVREALSEWSRTEDDTKRFMKCCAP